MDIAGVAHGVSATLKSDGNLAVIVQANYDKSITEGVTRTLFRRLRRVLARK